MIPYVPTTRNRIIALLLGLATSLAMITLGASMLYTFDPIRDFGEIIDGFVYDHLFYSHQSPSEDLVIVDLQTPAHTNVRPRCALLLQALQRAGARTIAFDVIFAGEKESASDASLAAATAACSTVVHAFNLTSLETAGQQDTCLRTRHTLRVPIMPTSNCFRMASAVVPPFPALRQASSQLAHVNLEPDADGGIRRFPLILGYGNEAYAGLPLQAVRSSRGVNDSLLEIHVCEHECEQCHLDDFLLFKKDSLKIPVDPDGRVLINFVRARLFHPYSTDDALLHASIDSTFKNKIVLVVNSTITEDYSDKNPLGERQLPNWVIHASVISQILNNAPMTDGNFWETLFFVGCATLLLLVWRVTGRLQWAWIRKHRWLTPVAALVLFLLVIFLRLNLWGRWSGFVLPSLGLCAGYLATKFYLDRKKPRPIQYKDLTLHVQKKSGATYLVDVIDSPAGQARDGEFTFEKDEAEEFLGKLRADDATQEEMRTFGKKLFDKLFQPAINRCYYESRGLIKATPATRLRLKLMIESPALVTLPWELMYDPNRREYLALTPELSLVRFLMTQQERRALTVAPPLKVLVASASPSGHAFLPGIAEEQKRIRQILRPHIRGHLVKLDFLPNLTVQALSQKLKEGYHVLHYTGHGTFQESAKGGEGCLIFENESGDAEPVNTARLELLLRDSEVRLVILNACQTAQTSRFDYFTGTAQALVSAGLPAVIAMQHKIFDDSGVVFAETFYRSLTEQFQIDMAVQAARKELAIRSKVEKMDWGTPVLFMRSSNGIILSSATP